MLVGFAYLALFVLGPLACWATRPAASRARADADRRMRFLQRNPERASVTDIERMLSREISPYVASFVCRMAAVHAVTPKSMWAFAQRFGTRNLALVVSADMTDADLRRCVERGALPDRQTLDLFASFNGLPPVDIRAATPHHYPLNGPGESGTQVA